MNSKKRNSEGLTLLWQLYINPIRIQLERPLHDQTHLSGEKVKPGENRSH